MLAFELDGGDAPELVAPRAARAAPGRQRDRARRPSASCRRWSSATAELDEALARLRPLLAG